MASDTDSCSDVFDRLKEVEANDGLGTYQTELASNLKPLRIVSDHIMASHQPWRDMGPEIESPIKSSTIKISEGNPDERVLAFGSNRAQAKHCDVFPSKSADWIELVTEGATASLTTKGGMTGLPSPVQSRSLIFNRRRIERTPVETLFPSIPQFKGPLKLSPSHEGSLEKESGASQSGEAGRNEASRNVLPRFIMGSPPVIVPQTGKSSPNDPRPNGNRNGSGKFRGNSAALQRRPVLTERSPRETQWRRETFIYRTAAYYQKDDLQAKSKTLPLQTARKPSTWNEYASRLRENNAKYEWKMKYNNKYYRKDAYLSEDLIQRMQYQNGTDYSAEPNKTLMRNRRERRKPPTGEPGWNEPCYVSSTTSSRYLGKRKAVPTYEQYQSASYNRGWEEYHESRSNAGTPMSMQSDVSSRYRGRSNTGTSQQSEVPSSYVSWRSDVPWNGNMSDTPQPVRQVKPWSGETTGQGTRIFNNSYHPTRMRQPCPLWRPPFIPPNEMPYLPRNLSYAPRGVTASALGPTPFHGHSLQPHLCPKFNLEQGNAQNNDTEGRSAKPTVDRPAATMDEGSPEVFGDAHAKFNREPRQPHRTNSTASQTGCSCLCRHKTPDKAVSPPIIGIQVPASPVYTMLPQFVSAAAFNSQFFGPQITPPPLESVGFEDSQPPNFLQDILTVNPDGKIPRARLLDQRLDDVLRSRTAPKMGGHATWFSTAARQYKAASNAQQKL
ncbi:hypothetical protein BV898_08242 [Hypsibius exemplaris]|uniref:Uncharacterized protein n=1 Tax=Hypsibius exemplaris TaxID=2072580 RepID=A0A1W0WR36_HYPEX|nr:hypothetical protein BV898_08242 [Hypsibius exemplaris]